MMDKCRFLFLAFLVLLFFLPCSSCPVRSFCFSFISMIRVAVLLALFAPFNSITFPSIIPKSVASIAFASFIDYLQFRTVMVQDGLSVYQKFDFVAVSQLIISNSLMFVILWRSLS
eukprot:896494_1